MSSQIEDDDITRPLGHGVSVHGGREDDIEADGEAMELAPRGGIKVKMEVTVCSEGLERKDRLF